MDKIKLFDEITKEFFDNYSKVCRKQDCDVEELYYSEQNIENLFDRVKIFLASKGDITTQQAIALELMSESLHSGITISTHFLFDSPIEFLLYTALKKTMPFYIFQQAYLSTQVEVCNNKYRLNIALIKRKSNDDNENKNIIIGIECNGYDTNYADKKKATQTAERIREIKMREHIEVFQYTGSEICSRSIPLAKEFWRYVEENIFPPIKNSSLYNYDNYNYIYEYFEEYLKHPDLTEEFFVYRYEHMDVLDFMPSAEAVLGKYNGYNLLLDKVKSKLSENGWEGDGEIQLLWLPPFCDLVYEDTCGIIAWFVKQENNGTSFICSPCELHFKCLDYQNQF